jgi:hypothetical protein
MSRRKKRSQVGSRVDAIDQKVKAALHCVQLMRPLLEPKGKRQMVNAILSLGDGEQRAIPRKKITGGQCVELVWRNSQCIHARAGSCPLLVFDNQLAQELNAFFGEE